MYTWAWMKQHDEVVRRARRGGLLVGVLLSATILALSLSSLSQAQETETPAGDAQDAPDTVVRIEVGLEEPLPAGEEFEALVFLDDVEHVAAFGFTIEYDPKRVEPVRADDGGESAVPDPGLSGDDTYAPRIDDLGDFLLTSDRGSSLLCLLQVANEVVRDEETGTTVDGVRSLTVDCVTAIPPVCLDGPEGASGSGLLGRLFFKSKGSGSTTLRLTSSTLILDDAQPPCDPDDFGLQEIQHRQEDASVLLAGGGGGSSTLVIVIAVVAVAVVVVGGIGGYVWYQRREGGSSA